MYQIILQPHAKKNLKRLDITKAKEILKRIKERLSVDPYHYGYPLRGGLAGHYKYRIGDYRVIYTVEYGQLIIHIVDIGHRKEVYK